MTDAWTLPERLKRLIASQPLMTATKIAADIGISERHLRNVMDGKRPPGKKAWPGIARALGIDPKDTEWLERGYAIKQGQRQRTPDQLFVILPTLETSAFWTNFLTVIMVQASVVDMPGEVALPRAPSFGATTFIHGESVARCQALLTYIAKHRTRAFGVIVALPRDISQEDRKYFPLIEKSLAGLKASGVPLVLADLPLPGQEPDVRYGALDQETTDDRLSSITKIGPRHRQMGRTAADAVLKYVPIYRAFILADQTGPEMARVQGIADGLKARIVDQDKRSILTPLDAYGSDIKEMATSVLARIGRRDLGSDRPSDPNYRGIQDCINEILIDLNQDDEKVDVVFCTTSFLADRLHRTLLLRGFGQSGRKMPLVIAHDAAGGMEYLRPEISYFNYSPVTLAERCMLALRAMREQPDWLIEPWDMTPALLGKELMIKYALTGG